jgi:hypothetical protein
MPIYGQSTKADFLLIKDNPTPETKLSFTQNESGCCFVLPVFAETVFTSDFYNDKFCPLFFWNRGFSTADLWLQKYVNGVWVDTVELNIDDWTETNLAYDPSVFGFFENIYNEKAIGYQLSWRLVLTDSNLGAGTYRIKSTGTAIFGGTVSKYSLEFCLQEYTQPRADETVRIEWWLNGNIGNPDDDQLKRDYGTLNWYNQIRLPGSRFGYDTSQFEREFVKYQNGKEVWLTDKQIEEYILKTGYFDRATHRYIKIDILQADDIRITDYNIQNPTPNQNKFVIVNGNYEPVWQPGTLYAPVEIKFQQAYQNLNHKRY